MARILFVTADAIDPAVLLLAAELRRRAHDVRVLGHAEQYPRVAAAGAGFAALSLTPGGLSPEVRALDPRLGAEVQLELARRPPELVVVEATLMTAVKAATAAGPVTAVLVPGLFGDVAAWARGPIRLAARLRRLRPAVLWQSADRVLVASDAELDQADALPANACRTGPVLGPLRARIRELEPLVVLDLRDEAAARSVLDALGDTATAVVIGGAVPGAGSTDGHAADAPTTGEGVGERGSAGGGAQSRPRAPSPALDRADALSRAWLFVGDGGHSSTMQALANDLPVLAAPSALMDAVAAAGAGRILDRDPAAAVRALLADGPHHGAAATLGERLRVSNGTRKAADELEALAERRSRTP